MTELAVLVEMDEYGEGSVRTRAFEVKSEGDKAQAIALFRSVAMDYLSANEVSNERAEIFYQQAVDFGYDLAHSGLRAILRFCPVERLQASTLQSEKPNDGS